MADAHIRFEREDLEGVIPVGSYVGDALRRFGVKGFERCTTDHDCVVTIKSGADQLSAPTSVEKERLDEKMRTFGDRLACHAKIEKPGEIVVMTKERAEEPKPDEDGSEKYHKEFAELPLEQKFTELMKLEAMALGDTLSFIVNSPYKVFEKIGDVMADFGMKLENKARDAKRPEEHKEDKAKNEPEPSESSVKSAKEGE